MSIKFSTSINKIDPLVVVFVAGDKTIPDWGMCVNKGSFAIDTKQNKIFISVGATVPSCTKIDLAAFKSATTLMFKWFDKNYQIDINAMAKALNKPVDLVVKYFSLVFTLGTTSKLSLKTGAMKAGVQTGQMLTFVDSSGKLDFDHLRKIADKQALIAAAITQTQIWSEQPPNLMQPSDFVNSLKDYFVDTPTIKLTVLDSEALAKINAGLILAVNAGSPDSAYFVVAEYTPLKINRSNVTSSGPAYGLVGMGMTFDSGGYNLKPGNSMRGMKHDLAGAAISMASLKVAAQLGAARPLVAVAPISLNMINEHATLPDSVVKSYSGKMVEISNIDAEGLLIQADAVAYTLDKYKPEHLVSIATVSGGVVASLGNTVTGMFNPQKTSIGCRFASLAKWNWELVWPLPVTEESIITIKSSLIADLKNAAPTNKIQALNSAAFLNEFVKPNSFLHLDIGGTAVANEKGTGVHLSTLVDLITDAPIWIENSDNCPFSTSSCKV